MPQIFQPRSNSVARVILIAIALLVAGLGWGLHAVYWSPYSTRVNIPLEQTVPFSHEHHAGGLGIDCRYCHSSVETSAFAGMPPTETCMTCHSQLWTDAPMLAPVRQSLASGKPIEWRRVHDLPDFCLLQSQHSCAQRDRLFELPWASRQDAADLSGQHALHEVVFGLPQRAGKVHPPAG